MVENKRSRLYCLTFDPGLSYSITVSNSSSRDAGPIVTKFHIEPPGAERRKVYSNSQGQMTNMATMPIHGKNRSIILKLDM